MGAKENFSPIESCPKIIFVVDEPLVSHFFMLLQNGVTIRARIGCKLSAFLSGEIGADKDTIERIQSVFLDGKVVDDLASATIKDGSVLALSAAMPGLVGATLRRCGTYSSFRSAVTYHESGSEHLGATGLVQVKIFNLLMADLGPRLLQKGVIIKSNDLIRFAAGESEEFWRGCREVRLDEKTFDAMKLADPATLSGKDHVSISVFSYHDRA